MIYKNTSLDAGSFMTKINVKQMHNIHSYARMETCLNPEK